MMEQEKEIKINEAMESFNGMQRAEAPVFFYTRLRARMDQQGASSVVWSFVTRPVFSLATVAVLLLINIATITHHIKMSNAEVVVDKTTGIESFVQEFNLSASSVYNNQSAR